MNIRKIVRYLKNFLVPTPATVRRHRAPSARFSTLEALAASHGDTLTRDGRSYQLVTSAPVRVLEFDNLSQVKAYLAESTGLVATPDAVVAGNLCDHKTNADAACDLAEIGFPDEKDEAIRNEYKAAAAADAQHVRGIVAEAHFEGDRFVVPFVPCKSFVAPPPAPFVPVIVAPIVAPTTDITRD